MWSTVLDYYHHHGPGASPVLVDNLLIIPCDGFRQSFYDRMVRPDVREFQYIAALDAQTGAIRWKRPRQGQHSYSTPLVVDLDGQRQVISPGGDRVTAYDPTTGRPIWWCRYGGYSVVPRPVYGKGLVYVCTGFDHPSLLAIRPDGGGDVTDTHVVWTIRHGVPVTTSPLLVDDELYLVSDTGILTCVRADTGKLLWRQRLGGNFSASPLWADDRIYLADESGVTHVVAAGSPYRPLAKNQLDGRIFASFAVFDRAFYVRTDGFLYRIEEEGH
jgi:outer membrane protein assembly factor BamB